MIFKTQANSEIEKYLKDLKEKLVSKVLLCLFSFIYYNHWEFKILNTLTFIYFVESRNNY